MRMRTLAVRAEEVPPGEKVALDVTTTCRKVDCWIFWTFRRQLGARQQPHVLIQSTNACPVGLLPS